MDASPWNAWASKPGVAERRQEMAEPGHSTRFMPSLRDSCFAAIDTPDLHPGLRPVVPAELFVRAYFSNES